MARYIDAETALEDIRNLAEKHHMNGEYEFANGILKAITRIKSQPTADVKEVVHGEWIDIDGNDEHYKCSICNKTINGNGIPYYFNFCHKCGADMREGEAE